MQNSHRATTARRAVGRRRSASPAAAQQPAADASQPRKHGARGLSLKAFIDCLFTLSSNTRNYSRVELSHPQHFSTRLSTVCGLPSRLNSAPSSHSRLTVIVRCSVIHAACTFIDPLVLIVCCFSRFGFLVAMVTRLCTSPPAFVCGFSSFLSSSAGRPSLYASSWNQEHVARCQSAPLNMPYRAVVRRY